MTKKIILILMLCCFIISCGKKGDPVYKDPEKKAQNHNIFLNKA
tara:strand:- start:188 stop:319 length:132 start_codon:yes stop_codon:yes gene_type:complete